MKKIVDFVIKDTNSSGAIYTDKSFKLNNMDFTTPKTLFLQSISSIVGGSFTRYDWSVQRADGMWEVFDYGSSKTSTTFTLTSGNQSKYLKDGRIYFKLSARDDASIPKTITSEPHFTGFYMDIPVTPTVSEPVADLKAKSRIDEGHAEEDNRVEVMAGDYLRLDARDSYATEEGAEIVDYSFDLPSNAVIVNDHSERGQMRITFPDPDTNKEYADVRVKDSKGNAETSDTLTIKVIDPVLDLNLKAYGTLKQNRKVTISIDESSFPQYYPLDQNSIDYTITPLDGQTKGYTTPSGSDRNSVFDIQFHDYGRYKIDCSAEIYSRYSPSKTRYSDSVSMILTIAEDKPPHIEFSVTNLTIRDPKNRNLAAVEIKDESYSTDNDKIGSLILYRTLDTDDDGMTVDQTKELVTPNFRGSIIDFIDKKLRWSC